MSFTSATPEQLAALAAALGQVVQNGDILGLVGDLGAGKTTFVQGLAHGLGIARVTSPTFTLIHRYEGGRLILHHADLYRLEDEAELDAIGLDDIYRQDGVCAVEWWDRFPRAQPAEHLELRIDVEGGGRRLTATPHGERARQLLDAWRIELGKMGPLL